MPSIKTETSGVALLSLSGQPLMAGPVAVITPGASR
jgi:hypothetical protein